MTTIVADLRDGSIYTDSRATYTSIRWTWKGRKKKIVGFEKSMKVFNLKGLLCARVGDVRGSNAIVSLLEKKTYHENHKRVWKTLEGHSGGVVIVRPGYCIHLRVDDCGTMCRKVFFGNTNIRLSSAPHNRFTLITIADSSSSFLHIGKGFCIVEQAV